MSLPAEPADAPRPPRRGTVLVLGGSEEGRALADTLYGEAIPVTTSLAGRVADPRHVSGEVRVGGFGGLDGLLEWLAAAQPLAVVDATHAFATRMGASAAEACARLDLPLVRLQRAGWLPIEGDDWRRVPSVAAAAAALDATGTRALLTTGRQSLAPFAEVDAWCLVRCITPPEGPMPAHGEVLLDRGPFHLAEERALLARRDIDVLVTKDSGGKASAAKLAAARARGIPVLMVDRPARTPGVKTVASVPKALDWVRATVAAKSRRGA